MAYLNMLNSKISGLINNDSCQSGLTESVYQTLVKEIVGGVLGPGQRIRQAALAERLGVSRAPISHALQLLKQSGLVRESGKMGVEVAPVSANKVRDLYQIRARMDGLAARLAAARVKFGVLPQADMEGLRQAFQLVLAAAKNTSIAAQVRADSIFHQRIYDVCGNAEIATTMAPLWSHIERAMVLVLDVGSERKKALAEHKSIMDGIVDGRPEDAEQQAFLHATNAGLLIENRLRGVG